MSKTRKAAGGQNQRPSEQANRASSSGPDYTPAATRTTRRTIPTIAGRLIRGETAWQVVIFCPYCSEEHIHGAGPITGRPYGGHRVSHCRKAARNPGYEIVIVQAVP